MARPELAPIFEEEEHEIRARMVESIPDTWRKEPGDFMHDAVAASPLEIKQLQIQQDYILAQGFAQYAQGYWLDQRLAERGLTRAQATKGKRKLQLTADAGVVIPKGQTASTVVLDGGGNPLEFEVETAVNFAAAGTLDVILVAQQPGALYNVAAGSEFILLPPIPGVRAIVDAGPTVLGIDRESDESAYQRYDYAVKNPDTGGNKHDYVRWSQDVTGVGKAKCIPRWNGNGTVKVVLVGTDYRPAIPTLVTEVQEYLDPGSKGEGEGKAPCGAQVTAKAADPLTVNISAKLTVAPGGDLPAIRTAFESSLDEYFKELVFVDDAKVTYNRISAILTLTKGVANFTNLTINGGMVDLSIGTEAVPVRGTVTFT